MTRAIATRPRRPTANREVSISNPAKALYPSGFTKADVVDYYTRIAPVMLPHLRDRAVTLKRYPNGSNAIFFFEKNCPKHHPDWIKTLKPEGHPNTHCLLNDRPALAWAANLAALEIHVPLAKADTPNRPTCVVFDLDPGPGVTIADCCKLALKFRETLADVGLQSFPKTSGGKGLHLYIPLNTPNVTFEQTKSFALATALLFARHDPEHVTAEMSKALRPGRVFIDWSQNDRHKTTVCAYSLRAKESPTVSTPLTWPEVERAARSRDPDILTFTAPQVLKRVARHGDLFAPVATLRQKLKYWG